MLEEVLKQEAKKIAKKYKIGENEVLEKLKAEGENTKEGKKEFKKLLKKVKKNIYYELRTYKRKEGHISILERDPYLEKLLSNIDGELKSAKSIIDVGGGMFPITFPFEKYPNINKYVWIDKDKTSYRKLKSKFGKMEKLVLFNHKVGEQPWSYYGENFDVALLLKFVPVISRQEKHLLKIVSEIPAKQIVITGNKEALTKRADIKYREDKIIRNFIAKTGRKITKSFDIGNEFGYVI